MIEFFHENVIPSSSGLYYVGSNIYTFNGICYMPLDNNDKSRGCYIHKFIKFNDIYSVILNDVVEVSNNITRSRYDFSGRILIDFEIINNRYQLDIYSDYIDLSLIDNKCRYASISTDFTGYKDVQSMIDGVLNIIND